MNIQTVSQRFRSVPTMFRAGDIRRNVLLKFTRLCMETPCLCVLLEKACSRLLRAHKDVTVFSLLFSTRGKRGFQTGRAVAAMFIMSIH